MEISERELRSMAREVDEQHREGMATMAADAAELHSLTRPLRATSRRRFLAGAGAGGLTLTIGSAVLPIERLLTPAAAQALNDEEVAAFAESLELAAVETYGKVLQASQLKTAGLAETAAMFSSHHVEHARAFGSAAGTKASGKANVKLAESIGDQLKGARDEKAALRVLADLETAAAATYLFALGALQAPSGLQLAASILPVESQHAAVLGQALGKPMADYVPPFESKDKSLDPAKFPVLK